MKFTVIIMEMLVFAGIFTAVLFHLSIKKKQQQVFITIRLIFRRNISERIHARMYPTGQKMSYLPNCLVC